MYHLYIAFWGGYMLPTTFYGNLKNPLNQVTRLDPYSSKSIRELEDQEVHRRTSPEN